MGGPLQQLRGEGWYSKAIVVLFVVGGAATERLRGRTTLEKRRKSNREFDATKGFPGEDVVHSNMN